MRTNELSGAALDWAVASIELTGHDDYTNVLMVTVGDDNDWKYTPSTDWAQGGAIIEREGICLVLNQHRTWDAHKDNVNFFETGTTPLIAAMRCYVASKLGDEIELPEGVR
jgi:hypothetical protein